MEHEGYKAIIDKYIEEKMQSFRGDPSDLKN